MEQLTQEKLSTSKSQALGSLLRPVKEHAVITMAITLRLVKFVDSFADATAATRINILQRAEEFRQVAESAVGSLTYLQLWGRTRDILNNEKVEQRTLLVQLAKEARFFSKDPLVLAAKLRRASKATMERVLENLKPYVDTVCSHGGSGDLALLGKKHHERALVKSVEKFRAYISKALESQNLGAVDFAGCLDAYASVLESLCGDRFWIMDSGATAERTRSIVVLSGDLVAGAQLLGCWASNFGSSDGIDKRTSSSVIAAGNPSFAAATIRGATALSRDEDSETIQHAMSTILDGMRCLRRKEPVAETGNGAEKLIADGTAVLKQFDLSMVKAVMDKVELPVQDRDRVLSALMVSPSGASPEVSASPVCVSTSGAREVMRRMSDELGIHFDMAKLPELYINPLTRDIPLYERRKFAVLGAIAGSDSTLASDTMVKEFFTDELNRQSFLGSESEFQAMLLRLGRVAKIFGAIEILVAFQPARGQGDQDSGLRAIRSAMKLGDEKGGPLSLSQDAFTKYHEGLKLLCEEIGSSPYIAYPEFRPENVPSDFASGEGFARIRKKLSYETIRDAVACSIDPKLENRRGSIVDPHVLLLEAFAEKSFAKTESKRGIFVELKGAVAYHTQQADYCGVPRSVIGVLTDTFVEQFESRYGFSKRDYSYALMELIRVGAVSYDAVNNRVMLQDKPSRVVNIPMQEFIRFMRDREI